MSNKFRFLLPGAVALVTAFSLTMPASANIGKIASIVDEVLTHLKPGTVTTIFRPAASVEREVLIGLTERSSRRIPHLIENFAPISGVSRLANGTLKQRFFASVGAQNGSDDIAGIEIAVARQMTAKEVENIQKYGMGFNRSTIEVFKEIPADTPMGSILQVFKNAVDESNVSAAFREALEEALYTNVRGRVLTAELRQIVSNQPYTQINSIVSTIPRKTLENVDRLEVEEFLKTLAKVAEDANGL